VLDYDVLSAMLCFIEECAQFDGDEQDLCELLITGVTPLFEFRSAMLASGPARHDFQFERIVGVGAPPETIARLGQRSVRPGTPRRRRARSALPTVRDARNHRSLFTRHGFDWLPGGHFAYHGHSVGVYRTYFAFAGIRNESGARLRMILRFLAPHLHALSGRVLKGFKPGAHQFSPAEQQVIRCLLACKSNKEIARILGKSSATVRNQLHTVFRKVNARSRSEAISRLQGMAPASITNYRATAGGMEHPFYCDW
jgi:DNA-binding CsgD family transcriptional regulator